MGNLWSVTSALTFLGANCKLSSDPSEIEQAEILLLPGVGSFHQAMSALREKKLVEPIKEAVIGKKRKILGICLGMQLLAESGTEDGVCQGLGFLSGCVQRFPQECMNGLKVPHVGFNRVSVPETGILFSGLSPEADFYFVHSYHLPLTNLAGNVAVCRYGVDFVAAYECENVFATQFHPEKSQTNGLRLLSNFLAA